MKLNYRILNVFTTDGARLSGNPLCVFEDGSELDAATMQALARQTNLSETTFILPSRRAAALVRIYTPAYEMAFAGHPTLGTAHVCRSLGLGGDQLSLEMRAGDIAVTGIGDRWSLRAVPASVRTFDRPNAELALLLGLGERDIGDGPLWVNAGSEQLIVPLTSEAAVRGARPRSELMGRIRNDEGAAKVYVFAIVRQEEVLARFFFPSGEALLEDPATGSACANLGAWLVATGHRPPLHFEIKQGEQAGRPSKLQLQVDGERQIFVAGEVIELGRGHLTL